METILKCFIILLLTTSCVGQGMNIKAKSSNNSKATEIRKNEEVKPDLSGRQRKDYVTGEILVMFKDGTDMQTIEMIKNKLHLNTVRMVSSPNLYLMKIQDGSSIEQVMESLREYEKVKYSEPNYVRTLQ